MKVKSKSLLSALLYIGFLPQSIIFFVLGIIFLAINPEGWIWGIKVSGTKLILAELPILLLGLIFIFGFKDRVRFFVGAGVALAFMSLSIDKLNAHFIDSCKNISCVIVDLAFLGMLSAGLFAIVNFPKEKQSVSLNERVFNVLLTFATFVILFSFGRGFLELKYAYFGESPDELWGLFALMTFGSGTLGAILLLFKNRILTTFALELEIFSLSMLAKGVASTGLHVLKRDLGVLFELKAIFILSMIFAVYLYYELIFKFSILKRK